MALRAIAAGSEEARERSLADYGRLLGLAFQAADDILDVEGTPEELGKSVGKDDATGKMTYPALLGVDGAKSEAGRLARSAVDALAGFGSEADLLRALPSVAVQRRS